MAGKTKKLAVAYRIYPGVSKVPPAHSDDKYKLSELCLKSFAESVSKVDYKVWAILDNCPGEYVELFRKYFPDERLEIIRLDGAGNAATFKLQIDLLLTQDFAEYIYFAEDDYFYLPEAFSEMLELISTRNDADFVTSYDHPDYYKHILHNYKSKIITAGYRHWRTSASSCLTFMTTKSILKQTGSVFKTFYKYNNYDSSMFLSLTKLGKMNPLLAFFYLPGDLNLAKTYIKLWLYTPIQNLFGKKYKLFSPLPSLSTHMDSKNLAPLIGWKSLFSEQKP
ncbi:MAG: glycosyltransferase family 2 protein [Candidatus Kapaibacterium sp.]